MSHTFVLGEIARFKGLGTQVTVLDLKPDLATQTEARVLWLGPQCQPYKETVPVEALDFIQEDGSWSS